MMVCMVHLGFLPEAGSSADDLLLGFVQHLNMSLNTVFIVG